MVCLEENFCGKVFMLWVLYLIEVLPFLTKQGNLKDDACIVTAAKLQAHDHIFNVNKAFPGLSIKQDI